MRNICLLLSNSDNLIDLTKLFNLFLLASQRQGHPAVRQGPPRCTPRAGRTNLSAGKRKSVTTRGSQTGHRPAGREGRGPNRRGQQSSATGQVRNHQGQARWSSRAPLPRPRWLNQGLIPFPRCTDLPGRNHPSR